MRSIKNRCVTALLALLTIVESTGVAFAQKPEEIARGIPWFIGMIIVVIIVAVAAGLRQRKK